MRSSVTEHSGAPAHRRRSSVLLVVIASFGLGACGEPESEGPSRPPDVVSALSVGQPPVGAIPAPAGDPCDFSRSLSFGYDQVLSCYRSVPFCPDPGNPATCDRDAQVNHLRAAIEGFSDLRETYDALAHWRRKLNAAAKARFASDYDLFLAMSDVMASFRDAHWSYDGPDCFERTIAAVLPLEFGSMIARVSGAEEQIMYLAEPRPFFNEPYVAATGIDVSPYAGQRIVQINGDEPLHFFRDWARDGLRLDADDGINLMLILREEGYSLRTGSFNAFPESPTVQLVLETRAGVRTRIEVPWAFLPFAEFGFPPPPASSEEFRALCFRPAQAAPAAATRTAAPPGRVPVAVADRIAERRAWMAALAARHPGHPRSPAPPPPDFTEVPPDRLDRDITEIIPLQDGARTVAYTGDTVVIQLHEDFGQDWEDQVDAGATYACEHADRLIVDLRNNQGGFVSRGQSLAHYLNATAPVVPNAVFGYRELARSPAMNELRFLASFLVSLGFPPCWTGDEVGCVLKMPSGEPLTDPFWYAHGTIERRGNAFEAVTPLVTFRNLVPAAEHVIPCPGKFTGSKLIMLVNGANFSMAFFTPQLLRDVSTLVVEGGFLGEPMIPGSARGGTVLPTLAFQQDADYLAFVLGTEVKHRLPDLPRPITFRMEIDGFYQANLKDLFAERPPRADVQVPFWSSAPATDGAAYRAAVSAVERQSIVDPICGAPHRDGRACFLYQKCARGALDAAVARGALSLESAARTLEDAVGDCR